MATTLSTALQQGTRQPQRRAARAVEFTRNVLRNRLAAIGVLIVGGLLVAALLAPWLAPYDPEMQFADAARQPPSADYFFGTDNIGRDNFSRVLYGTRVSLFVGVASMLFAGVLGVTLGLAAG